ncbi:MAG: hypothetical protein RLZZ148_2342, partial [Cyanobacteriota bacterium]
MQEQGRGGVNREILLSPKVLFGTAERLQLSQDRVLEIRDKKLKIVFPGEGKTGEEAKEGEATSETQVILLRFTDTDQATAQLVLETLMKEMVDYSRWLNSSQLRSRIEAL